MGSDPHKYTATLVTPAPAVISIPEIGWSGSLVNLLNQVPSSVYNDVAYPIEKAAIAASGGDLQSLTNSHWVNYNGKLAFTFDMVIDPLTAEIVAGAIAGTVGVLIGLLVTAAAGWATWIGVVLGALAAIVTMAFEQVYVIDEGSLYPTSTPSITTTTTSTPSGTPSTTTSTTSTPSGTPSGTTSGTTSRTTTTTTTTSTTTGSPAGSSCSSTSQCPPGYVCQNGVCTQCNGVIIGGTCVPTWALIAGIGMIALTGVAIAMAKK
jgi:hypothetical protein